MAQGREVALNHEAKQFRHAGDISRRSTAVALDHGEKRWGGLKCSDRQAPRVPGTSEISDARFQLNSQGPVRLANCAGFRVYCDAEHPKLLLRWRPIVKVLTKRQAPYA